MMPRWPIIAFGAALLAAPAWAQRPPPPPHPPMPPPREEFRPPPPHARLVWQPGQWRWDGRSYVWVTGRWVEQPRHRRHWEPGHWAPRPGGRWAWVDGHWR